MGAFDGIHWDFGGWMGMEGVAYEAVPGGQGAPLKDSSVPPYWFHAKRYGLGWSLPARVEGWVFAALMFAFFCAMQAVLFLPADAAWVVLLVAVCAWKGDPRGMQWRWGDD